jgi:hypothetical protein
MLLQLRPRRLTVTVSHTLSKCPARSGQAVRNLHYHLFGARPCSVAGLPKLPAGLSPLKLVTDFLACLLDEVVCPTLKDHYGSRYCAALGSTTAVISSAHWFYAASNSC